jgi:hypothetical protein
VKSDDNAAASGPDAALPALELGEDRATAATAKGVFFRRRAVWLPTWRGWGCLLALIVVVGVAAGRTLHRFLAVTAPVPANVLVVEGWLTDHAVQEAVEQFIRGDYEVFVASGGPMPRGSLVSGYATYAALAAAAAQRLGLPKDRLIQAEARRTYRHRTFESAKAVQAKLREQSVPVRGVNVMTEGPHARRTRAVYRKVFGPDTPVGVFAAEPEEYDARRWWASSEGLKTTLVEFFGWLFEVLFDSGRDGGA